MPPQLAALYGLITLAGLFIAFVWFVSAALDRVNSRACPRCNSKRTELVSENRIERRELWLCRRCCHSWAYYRFRN